MIDTLTDDLVRGLPEGTAKPDEVLTQTITDGLTAGLENASEVGYNQTAVASDLPTSQSYQDLINDTELRDHIENVQPSKSGRNGIIGGHKKDSFLAAVQEKGAKIVSSTPHPTIDGVETIYYQTPALMPDNSPSGRFRYRPFFKTIYNSDVISTDQYMTRGLQAAADAAKSGRLGQEWVGKDNQGVLWRGYCDIGSGKVTSFFPQN